MRYPRRMSRTEGTSITSADELVRWIRDYLGPKDGKYGRENHRSRNGELVQLPSYKDAILKDAKASAYVPIASRHTNTADPRKPTRTSPPRASANSGRRKSMN